MGKNLFIKTFGCQMNEHDTEKIAGVLSNLGYSLTDSPDGADMIILNTCSVREKAEYKCYSDLGRLYELKKKNPALLIGVGGCVAQQEGERILSRAPYVDIVFGTDNIPDIPKLIEKKKQTSKSPVSTERRRKWSYPPPLNPLPQGGGKQIPPPPSIRLLGGGKGEGEQRGFSDEEGVSSIPVIRNHPVKAYVNIVDGCDKFCTFCVVPFTRGRERSRRPDDICNEIRRLASASYKEVTLLGQNVDSYGKDPDNLVGDPDSSDCDLADLLYMINEIPGIERMRFITSHPADFSDKLIDAMVKLSKVCEHFHLPLQSGSDAVLERMKRNYNYGEYRDKINRLRVAIPYVTITTDVITGFPGESEEDFKKTMDAIEELQFDGIFAFRYSKRPYTPARLYDEQVPNEVSRDRLNRVLQIQNMITLKKNQEYVGKEFEILVEGESKKNKRRFTGRTRGNKIVHIANDGGIFIGDTLCVRITSATLASLVGEVVSRGIFE